MSDTHELRLELAWAIAGARPRQADVDRLAKAARLDIQTLPAYARPIDTWSAVIAVAIEEGKLAPLLDAMNAEVSTIEKAKFQALEASRSTQAAPAIALALEWQDLEDAHKQDASRTVPAENALPVSAIVRVFGSDAPPTITWKWGTFFAGKRETQRPEPESTPNRNFSVWRFDKRFDAYRWRTGRLEVKASIVGGGTARASRTVSTIGGRNLAVGLLALTVVFMIFWLDRYPSFQETFGLAAGVLGLAVLVARTAIDVAALGPMWGLVVPERALAAAIGTVTALVFLPPVVFVMAENPTQDPAVLRASNGRTFSLGPGERRLVLRTKTPLEPVGKNRCMCHAGGDNKACSCIRPKGESKGFDVLFVGCKPDLWTNLANPKFEQKIHMTADCEPDTAATETVSKDAWEFDANARKGKVEVRYPWPKGYSKLRFMKDSFGGATVYVLAPNEDDPRITLSGIDDEIALNVINDDVTLHFKGATEGTLRCTSTSGTEEVHVVAFEASGIERVSATAGGAVSTWKGDKLVRICLRGQTVDSLELELTSLDARRLPQPPTKLNAAAVIYTRGETRFTACDGGDTWLISTPERGPTVKERTVIRATPKDTRNRRSWSILGVTVNNSIRGVICDPPRSPTIVTLEGRGSEQWLLSEQELIKLPPRPLDAFCKVDRNWASQQSMSSTPDDACVSEGKLHCKASDPDDIDARETARRHGCVALCVCSGGV